MANVLLLLYNCQCIYMEAGHRVDCMTFAIHKQNELNIVDITLAFRCPAGLVNELDSLVESGAYMNRADAGRDLLRLGIRTKENGNEYK